MNTRRTLALALTSLALLSGAILVPPLAGAAAASTLARIPFTPSALSDTGIVVGGFSPGYVWARGTATALPVPGGFEFAYASDVNDSGVMVGKAATTGTNAIARLVRWPSATAAPTVAGEGRDQMIFDDGRSLMTDLYYTAITRSDGTNFARPNDCSAISTIAAADDGAFLIEGNSYTDCLQYKPVPDPSLSKYVSPIGSATLLPTDVDGQDVASPGVVSGLVRDTNQVVLLEMVAGHSGWVRTSLGAPGTGQVVKVVNNGRRRVFAATVAPNFSVDIWSWSGKVWENWDARLAPPAGSTSTLISKLVAVNGWGDLAVGYNASDGGLYQSRVALTGQIAPTATAGTRSERSVGNSTLLRGVQSLSGSVHQSSFAGKHITVTDGPSPLDATAGATGTFSLQLPAGTWTLAAPSGACLMTGNGCHTSAIVSIADHGTTFDLSKLIVSNVATFTGKSGSKLRAAKRKVGVGVRCNAAIACIVKVTLKYAQKTAGTGAARIRPGTSSTVVVTLTPAAVTKLVSGKYPIAATMSVTAGTKASLAQLFVLTR